MALLPSSRADQKKLLVALIPLVGLFGYWYFLHGTATQEIEELETRLEQLEAQNTRARAVAARAGPELEERLLAYEGQIEQLERLIPQSEEVAELLNTTALRAQQTGVELDLLEPNLREPGAHYTRHTYTIRVLGGYHEVGRFLTAIGSLSRIVRPMNLQLQPHDPEEPDGPIRVQANFAIETYVLPAEPAAGEEAVADAST